MTEQEKQEIISELEKRFEEKYNRRTTYEDTLKKPREKWFRDSNGEPYKSLMTNAFGVGDACKIWDAIRKLTCIICSKQYVRQLCDTPYADEVAEKLCQFVYDLKIDCKDRREAP